MRANSLRKGHFIRDKSWLVSLVKEGSPEECSRQRKHHIPHFSGEEESGAYSPVGLDCQRRRTGWEGSRRQNQRAALQDSGFIYSVHGGRPFHIQPLRKYPNPYKKQNRGSPLFKKEKFEMRNESPFKKGISSN